MAIFRLQGKLATVSILLIGLASCDPRPAIDQTSRTEPRATPTMAERWGKTIRIHLDMPAALYSEQLPDDASAGWTGRRRDLREHTITWGDGSQVVTHWRPADIPGTGLVLDYIEMGGR